MSEPLLQEPPDFSLVLGGPIYQLFRRSRLSGDALEMLTRRILIITAFVWFPLLLLSAIDRHLLGGGVTLAFFHDIEAQVRFLIALPIVIAAELVVHLRVRPVVGQFLARRIVRPEDEPKFKDAIAAVMRVRNSIPVELSLLALAGTVGVWIWRSQLALAAKTWYGYPQGSHLQLTHAGYWYAFVSIPIFQFLLLRWYMRLGLWFWFLFRVSKLNLHLVPTHPDQAGGLAFLGRTAYAFAPLLFAQGSLLSGLIASRVLYGGQSLLSFKMDAIGLVCLYVVLILGPLVVFTPKLAQAKRQGLAEYGALGSQYVLDFEGKWIRENKEHSDELLGSGDIQSLADLGNSYSVVREMRLVPFGLQDITRLAAATAIPLLPLGLTVFSLEELIIRVAKILF